MRQIRSRANWRPMKVRANGTATIRRIRFCHCGFVKRRRSGSSHETVIYSDSMVSLLPSPVAKSLGQAGGFYPQRSLFSIFKRRNVPPSGGRGWGCASETTPTHARAFLGVDLLQEALHRFVELAVDAAGALAEGLLDVEVDRAGGAFQ